MSLVQITDFLDPFESARPSRFGRRNIIIHGNDKPQNIYLIESGYVKLYHIDHSGDEHIYAVLQPGDVFPLKWMLPDVQAREFPIFYETLTPAVVRGLGLAEFKRHLSASPVTLVSVHQYVLGLVGMLMFRLGTMHIRSAAGRVASQLLDMGERFGSPAPGGVLMPLSSRQLIAGSTNLSRETVVREMSRLRRSKVLLGDSEAGIVLDLDRLKILVESES